MQTQDNIPEALTNETTLSHLTDDGLDSVFQSHITKPLMEKLGIQPQGGIHALNLRLDLNKAIKP
jgi:hypothetical protein